MFSKTQSNVTQVVLVLVIYCNQCLTHTSILSLTIGGNFCSENSLLGQSHLLLISVQFLKDKSLWTVFINHSVSFFMHFNMYKISAIYIRILYYIYFFLNHWKYHLWQISLLSYQMYYHSDYRYPCSWQLFPPWYIQCSRLIISHKYYYEYLYAILE